jgi:hypothetical protein
MHYPYLMKRLRFAIVLLAPGLVVAQTGRPPAVAAADSSPPFAVPGGAVSSMFSTTLPAENRTQLELPAPTLLPQMAPDLALETYQQRAAKQNADLISYSATTLIRAQLPDTSQSGEFELQRRYAAPHGLQFKAIRYTGDGFVKSNVITRLLQSEADHVQKDDASLTAITPANYKFNHKGMRLIDGRMAHVYEVKPHKKRPGLFKGRIYLDAASGSLVRVEGTLVKSPSFFIKKIDFVQDYADFGGFTFPVHIHSEARARIVGRAIVDIDYRDYQPVASTVQSAQQMPAL